MRASTEGDRLLYELGMLFARGRRLAWTAAARRLEENGYSPLWWGVLAFLSHHGSATQRDIADEIGQHPAGVSRLVDELAEAKLVRRRRDTEDRRRARIELTARGQAMFEQTQSHVLAGLREAMSPLSAAEQRRLIALMKKLMSAVDAEAKSGSREKKTRARRPGC